jgi:hypothetical protein
LGSFSIDPRVEELQKIQERALTELNVILIETEKGYFPTKKFVLFTGLSGDSCQVEYIPTKDLDSNLNAVKYPIPGADINQMSVAVSQLVGSELLSRRTGRILHPLIEDPDEEQRLMVIQKLEDSVLAATLQQATTGAIPISDQARILELVEEGSSVVKAISQAHDEAQKRQAQQAPPPDQGQASAPGAMPGLAQPGQGAEMQPPAIPQASSAPSLANFRQLTQQLKANPNPAPINSPAA